MARRANWCSHTTGRGVVIALQSRCRGFNRELGPPLPPAATPRSSSRSEAVMMARAMTSRLVSAGTARGMATGAAAKVLPEVPKVSGESGRPRRGGAAPRA